MGMIIYPEYRKAFDEAENKLSEEQQSILFYVYSNLKVGNLDSENPNADLEFFEPLKVTKKEIFRNKNIFYNKGEDDKLINDLSEMVNKKSLFKIIKGKYKDKIIGFFTIVEFKDDYIEFSVPWIIRFMLITEQMMKYAIDQDENENQALVYIKFMFGFNNCICPDDFNKQNINTIYTHDQIFEII